MQILLQLPEAQPEQELALALGMFDGLHLGHYTVLEQTLRQAERLNLKPAVLTFSNHPMEALAPDKAPRLLCLPEQKSAWLASLGFHQLFMLPFDSALQGLSATAFLYDWLINRLNTRAISIGFNFHFGYKRQGSADWLLNQAKEETCPLRDVAIAKPHPVSPEAAAFPISSSSIRKALQTGAVGKACRMLGRPYSLEGVVTPGRQLARQLGFPTANLLITGVEILQLPAYGVYSVYALAEGWPKPLPAIANLGLRPTVQHNSQPQPLLEVHLLETPEASSDLYGKTITVYFSEYLRHEQRFETIDKLKQQIAADVHQAARWHASHSPEASTTHPWQWQALGPQLSSHKTPLAFSAETTGN